MGQKEGPEAGEKAVAEGGDSGQANGKEERALKPHPFKSPPGGGVGEQPDVAVDAQDEARSRGRYGKGVQFGGKDGIEGAVTKDADRCDQRNDDDWPRCDVSYGGACLCHDGDNPTTRLSADRRNESGQ